MVMENPSFVDACVLSQKYEYIPIEVFWVAKLLRQRKQEDQRHVQRGKATCCPYHLLDWFAEYTSAPETLHPKTSAETAHRCGGCVEKIVESQRRFQLPHKRPMHSLYPQCLCALPKYGWDDVSSNIGRCHVHVTIPLFGSSPRSSARESSTWSKSLWTVGSRFL